MTLNIRHHRDWDRQLEGDLPDCRLRWGERQEIRRGLLVWHKVFCANCGCDGGLCTEHTTHIFYLCDDCVFKHGAPTGCREVKMKEL